MMISSPATMLMIGRSSAPAKNAPVEIAELDPVKIKSMTIAKQEREIGSRINVPFFFPGVAAE